MEDRINNIESADDNLKLKELHKDRALGCMVGGAVGDALGYAVEFKQWLEIERKFGPRGITRYCLAASGKALISDDTQMSLFTGAGILLGMTRSYMRGIMGRLDTYCRYTYLDWLHTQEWKSRRSECRVDSWLMDVPELYSLRSPGITCLTALKDLEAGKEVVNDSCGCGGVMRTAPIAILSYLHSYADGKIDYCDMVAAEAARITHKHPLGFLPSAVLNDILMQIMGGEADDGDRLGYVVEKAAERLPLIHSGEDGKTYGELWPKEVSRLQEILSVASDLASSDLPDHIAIERIGGGWTGHEALAIAVYSALKHKDSFEDAIVSAVNHSGDSDSTGAVCGNIIGILLGRKAIPEYYTKDLELLDVIEEMGTDLYTGCIISERMRFDTAEKFRWYNKYCKHKWEPL
ncbi:MAG: ADP-ribosylglycohydrolase family protein [Bacteroidales bacterium]|nr:ADP-ribosylglycohydrolase family protein [Bacteroidales bacterium]